MIALLPLALAVGLFIATAPPSLNTPSELAAWSKCSPAKISYWIGQRVRYTYQPHWDPAELVMAREAGDCKGKASVAVEALNRCVGYEARIVTYATPTGRHAVAVYRDHKGRRGYIDDARQENFPPGTEWAEIAGYFEVAGGEW